MRRQKMNKTYICKGNGKTEAGGQVAKLAEHLDGSRMAWIRSLVRSPASSTTHTAALLENLNHICGKKTESTLKHIFKISEVIYATTDT